MSFLENCFTNTQLNSSGLFILIYHSGFLMIYHMIVRKQT